MEIRLFCAMCDSQMTIVVDTTKVSGGSTLGEQVEAAGWTFQQNGEHFDIYCSKRCVA